MILWKKISKFFQIFFSIFVSFLDTLHTQNFFCTFGPKITYSYILSPHKYPDILEPIQGRVNQSLIDYRIDYEIHYRKDFRIDCVQKIKVSISKLRLWCLNTTYEPYRLVRIISMFLDTYWHKMPLNYMRV